MPNALVVGTGLIGASVGLALRANGWTVSGWDPSLEALSVAVDIGAIDEAVETLDTGLADLVVLAGPHDAMVELLRDMRPPGLVIDVAGVKHEVVMAGARLARFVGTHPMAGREQSGPGAASGALFKGASWIVTTDGAAEADLVEAEEIISSFGAIPRRMTASEHDAAIALVSAVPHVISASLLHLVMDDPSAMSLAAGSFRDITRVSLSDPHLWADLFVANRADVTVTLSHLVQELQDWSALITSGDQAALVNRLQMSRDARQSLAPPVTVVLVMLEDKPGELAGVGRALNACQVDIRDLQLRHGEHGGGGVLRLSVRPGEAEALREALQAENFTVE
ncbi:MAG: prephenate dehydrogenase/arogenate dehydrogenase family protein [Acidimicrobiia bacterium]|nr:prephenate dehydrogenase/arogenate dehydrogenase family protein [Acidimicrobiia bacterium]